MLSTPIVVDVLEALAEEPRPLVNLRREAGFPPQTTMRGYLRELTEAGVVERHRSNEFPGPVAYELTDSGRGLLEAAFLLAAWLGNAPQRPIAFGSSEAKYAVKTLVDGWTSGMVHVLAAHPLSLTELNNVISSLSYPSLERRFAAMRRLGLLESAPRNARGTPHTVTTWLRQAVTPLVAAARWEQCHLREKADPVSGCDIEAAFLLSIPLLHLPEDATGTCRVAVQVKKNGTLGGVVGAMAELRTGTVSSCSAQLEGSADAWASGPAAAWLTAIANEDPRGLELGGESRLATALVEGLHGAMLKPHALR